jgi:hypothetical protein
MVALLPVEQLIYTEILKIASSNISLYNTVQDRLLWLIGIPHFIVALFLVSAMGWIAGQHKGLQLLGGVMIYLFLILGGWYGSMLVPIADQYFVITVGLMIVFFFLSRIFPPIYGPGAAKLGGALAGKLGEATIGKVRSRKEMEHQLEEVERAIHQLEQRYPQGHGMPDEASGIYASLLVKREELKRRLED